MDYKIIGVFFGSSGDIREEFSLKKCKISRRQKRRDELYMTRNNKK